MNANGKGNTMKMNLKHVLVAAGLAVMIPAAAMAQAAGGGQPPPPPAPPAGKAEAPAGAGRAAGTEARRAAAVERFVQQLRKDRPEEFQRLMELRKNDPEAFRKEMRERLLKNVGETRRTEKPEKTEKTGEKKTERTAVAQAEDKASLELAQKCRASQNPAEAAQLKAKLQAEVEAAFDKKTADQEARLKAAAAALELRKAKKGEICARRMQELLGERRQRSAPRRPASGITPEAPPAGSGSPAPGAP
jgi:hypothetical protein